jgi:alpha-L-fucosidase
VPAEVDVSIRPGWFYHPAEDSLVKTPQQLFDIYLSSVGRGSNLLLNVPPDRRGLIHERDVQVLREWRNMLDEAFSVDLASGAKVTADSYRGKSGRFRPANVTDGDTGTYWATDDDVLAGSLIIDFEGLETINFAVLQEYIGLGQRVRSFSIDAWQGKEWVPVARGTTIGYKRILRVPAVETSRLRINIEDAKACPVISGIGIY